MSAFNAELYLRIAGEEMLLGVRSPEQHRPWDSPLAEPARALVAVGAITPARARAVIDDYTFAQALRSPEGHHMHHRGFAGRAYRSSPTKPKPLPPRRVVPCNRTIRTAQGTLHVRHVTLSERDTSVAIVWRVPPAPIGRRGRRHGHMAMYGPGGHGPIHPQLTDDRGTSTGTHFSGGGSDEEWEGRLHADQPLAVDTAWIEIDGTRIELDGEAVACEVSIEQLPEEPVARRYLWRRLAIAERWHGPPDPEPTIDALVAAGALDGDDPMLDDVRRVQDTMPDHPRMHATRPSGTGTLPEPWRSLLRRAGREDGPEGMVPLAAVTPQFDGYTVAVSSLNSHSGGFSIEVEIAPALDHGPFGATLPVKELMWWAADDRDNHYLGQINGWQGGEDSSSGDIAFWPALHPKARHLRIMPTSDSQRAVISLPLELTSEDDSGSGAAP